MTYHLRTERDRARPSETGPLNPWPLIYTRSAPPASRGAPGERNSRAQTAESDQVKNTHTSRSGRFSPSRHAIGERLLHFQSAHCRLHYHVLLLFARSPRRASSTGAAVLVSRAPAQAAGRCFMHFMRLVRFTASLSTHLTLPNIRPDISRPVDVVLRRPGAVSRIHYCVTF